MVSASTSYTSVKTVFAADTHVVPRRIAAFLVDAILLGVCWGIGVAIAAGAGLLHVNVNRTTTVYDDGTATRTWYIGSDNNAELFFSYWVIFLVIKTLLEHIYGRTPGKAALGIRVVSDDRQTGIGWGQSAVRNALLVAPFTLMQTNLAGPVLLGVVVGIAGCIAMATSNERQRLGDRAASTLVVRDRKDIAAPESIGPVGAPIVAPDFRPGAEVRVHCGNCNSNVQGKNLRWGVWMGRPAPLCPNCGGEVEANQA